ncbi:MAG: DUF881 domain-containing protein [Chloroflexota bacterium]|nr:DUF881 domain-containing protein [Chloroflexota bacterium]
MSGRLAHLSVTAVVLLLGFLLVIQLRSQARPTEISSLSAQDLSTLIETLSGRNRQLRAAVADAREQLREYRVAESQGQSALDVSREDLRRITAFGGREAVEGQGIVLTIDGQLDAIAVNDLLNELRNAGAEAIAVDAVRITARSVCVQAPLALKIDDATIGSSFTIRAVGDPDGLLTALQRPGGIISQLQLFVSATIDVQQSAQVTIPESNLDLAPRVAKPAE